MKITADNDWMGSYGDANGIHSVKGSGSQIYHINNPKDSVTVCVQKMSLEQSEFKVQIIQNGVVIAEKNTTESYGIVNVIADV